MDRMPALFIGHGSPMNLVEDNRFTRDLRSIATGLPHPKAIVLMSAHWATKGSLFTIDDRPGQIFDFYGFPDELYRVRYLPRGAPDVARALAESLGDDGGTSSEWGIDHAATIPLMHLFPRADVPVVEMGLDLSRPPEHHLTLGRRLSSLREEGLMFIASGNLVHTFREIVPEQDADPLAWAVEFDERLKQAIVRKDLERLVHIERDPLSRRAFQTMEHYLPMLYIMGMMMEDEGPRFVHEGFQHGTISHRSFIVQ